MKRLVKSAQFALLLLRLGIAQRMFEELAEQRDDQAGLEEVDEGLGITGCLLADGALQEFLRPEGVASELLRAVDGDRLASRGSSVVPSPRAPAIRLARMGQPAPAGLSEPLPTGGTVTGAGMVTRVDEGFQQPGLEAPVIEPVRAARRAVHQGLGDCRVPMGATFFFLLTATPRKHRAAAFMLQGCVPTLFQKKGRRVGALQGRDWTLCWLSSDRRIRRAR